MFWDTFDEWPAVVVVADPIAEGGRADMTWRAVIEFYHGSFSIVRGYTEKMKSDGKNKSGIVVMFVL